MQLLKSKNLAHQLLLLSCVVFLFVVPLFQDLHGWVSKLVFSLVIIFSLTTLENLNIRIAAAGIMAIFIGWLTRTTDFILLSYLSEMAAYIFLIWMVGSLLIQIMRLKEVNLFSLLEVVNCYLLLGILFSSLVLFLNKHFPGSYTALHGPLTGVDVVYYAFVTLTTTGYGDIIPSSRAAKELAILIAVSGQLYVAVIVAILVGKYANKN